MAGDSAGSEDLLRRLEAVSGMELDDLRRLIPGLELAGWVDPVVAERPRLRRPPRDEPAVYRVRVDIDGARPPIWRRLDLRSDLTLDVVHRVLQSAFGWLDYHLHRFSLGGGPFDLHSELFLCPFDVEEGEDDGAPASEVRFDETLQDPGDVLAYVYDYGDAWVLSIRLEEVLPLGNGDPAAACVDGRRAGPPEDCGGITDAEGLAEVLDDPAHFDIEAVNLALNDPYFVLRDLGVPSQLLDMAYRLGPSELGDDLTARLLSLTDPPPDPTPDEKAHALQAFLWFLDRAQGDGFKLTEAGYLKPADVEAASQVVPAMGDWYGKKNRETHTYPLLAFRKVLKDLGLVRKYKGTLRSTRMGAMLAEDPESLWHHVVRQLGGGGDEGFNEDATLLVLAHAATSTDGSLPLDKVAATLGELGWVDSEHGPVERIHLQFLEPSPLDVLWNVGATPGSWARDTVSPEATAIARAALQPDSPTP